MHEIYEGSSAREREKHKRDDSSLTASLVCGFSTRSNEGLINGSQALSALVRLTMLEYHLYAFTYMTMLNICMNVFMYIYLFK